MVPRGLLVLYVAILLWLVLLKTAVSISALTRLRHQRSLNLTPFAAPKIVNGRINYGEMIVNCMLFIPFGLLLDVNFKKPGFLRKLLFILAFSVAVEVLQYLFAIGAADITDVITNTAGGFIGLALYGFGNRYVNTEKLDRIITSAGIFLAILFISIYASHFILRVPKGL